VPSFVLAGRSAISVINPEGWIHPNLREKRAVEFVNQIDDVQWKVGAK
jgi:hypothetical protein